MNSKGRLAILSIVLFLLGGSFGFIGGVSYHKYKLHRTTVHFMKSNPRTMMLDTFTKELKLTPGQRKDVDAILETQAQSFKALFEETKPRYDALNESTRVEIKRLLTPEQLAKYDSLTNRWKKKMAPCTK